jgi:hypothetical protein
MSERHLQTRERDAEINEAPRSGLHRFLDAARRHARRVPGYVILEKPRTVVEVIDDESKHR